MPGAAAAAGAPVDQETFHFTDTFDSANICGWPSTFTTSGVFHYTVVIADAHHGHISWNTVENYSVTIHNEEGVPESVRGLTWRGRNQIAYEANFDPSTDRLIEHSVQTAFEGPFRAQIERITLHIAADGTVTRDETLTRWTATADCSQFV
jgi:hypothetical protein